MEKMDLGVRGCRPDDWYNCECFVCGKKMHRKPYWLKKNKHHNYCSKKCHYLDKKRYMSGEANHQYGLKGRLNASWKHDEKISIYGYKMIRMLDHPFVEKDGFMFEHRLVAEKYFLTNENSVEIDGKRYLKPEYHVHHKNFVKTDNRPENLQVMTKSEHQSLHERLKNPTRQRDKFGRFVKENIYTRDPVLKTLNNNSAMWEDENELHGTD